MAQHTPIPWRLKTFRDTFRKSYILGPIAQDGGDYAPIATADNADAAYIVKCVNMHDELVKFVAELIDTYGNARNYFDQPFPIVVKARALLSKANE